MIKPAEKSILFLLDKRQDYSFNMLHKLREWHDRMCIFSEDKQNDAPVEMSHGLRGEEHNSLPQVNRTQVFLQ